MNYYKIMHPNTRRILNNKNGKIDTFSFLLCLLLIVVFVFLKFQGDISTGKLFPSAEYNKEESQSDYTEGQKKVVPIGRCAEDDSLSEEIVFYTPEGECYHKTTDCPSLNDSDIIYKAYKGDASEDHRSCGICY